MSGGGAAGSASNGGQKSLAGGFLLFTLKRHNVLAVLYQWIVGKQSLVSRMVCDWIVVVVAIVLDGSVLWGVLVG